MTSAIDEAVASGNVEKTLQLISTTSDFEQALGVSAKIGKIDILQALLLEERFSKEDVNYRQALYLAAQNGHLEIVQHLIETERLCLNIFATAALGQAVPNGHLNVVQYLNRSANTAVRKNMLYWAARAGHLQVVQYFAALEDVDPKINNNKALRIASSNNHLDVVYYLLSLNGVKITADNNDEALIWANANTHYELIECLIGLELDLTSRLEWAARSGLMLVIECLEKRGLDLAINNSKALAIAAEYGRSHLVSYLIDKGLKAEADDNRAFCLAIQNEHISVAEYLERKANYRESPSLSWAAKKGRLDIVKYFLAKTDSWMYERKVDAYIAAAKYGHLNIVKYLRPLLKRGDFYDKEAICSAAGNQHLDVVQYLGLSVSKYTPPMRRLDWAAQKGHLSVIQCLEALGVDLTGEHNLAFRLAASCGHLDVVQYLAGCKDVNPADCNNEAICCAAEKGHREVLEYLLTLEQVNPNAQEDLPLCWAAAHGYLEIVQDLTRNKGASPTAQANRPLLLAVQYGRLNVVEYFASFEEIKLDSNNHEALRLAADHKQMEVFRYLAPTNPSELVAWAVFGKYFEVLKGLEKLGVDLALENNLALRLAANDRSPHLEMVKYLSCLDNNTLEGRLKWAVENNCHALVECLDRLDVNVRQNNNEALRLAAEKGHDEIARYLSYRSFGEHHKGCFAWAAENGHLAVIKSLIRIKADDPTSDNNYVLRMAAYNGQLEVVKYLVQETQPTLSDGIELKEAAEGGHLNVVEYLDQHTDPKCRNDILCWAARAGHLAIVQYFANLDGVNPTAFEGLALQWAARGGHARVVAYLLTFDAFSFTLLNFSKVIEGAVLSKDIETVHTLLDDGRVSVQDDLIVTARELRLRNIVTLLESYSLSGQIKELSEAHSAVLSYESEKGISGSESSMDVYFKEQAEKQLNQLSRKHLGEVLSESMCLLRKLVFEALQSHLEKSSEASQAKLSFLSEKIALLISGDESALSEAATLFNSNEDVYEIASRAVNNQARCVEWDNLLTHPSPDGFRMQRYASNIAREIESSKGKTYYDDCLRGLIYRLAEIRRAHNEGDIITTDNPSCLAGTKTRLFKVLTAHPQYSEHARAEWKVACYEAAAKHIETVFKKAIEESKSPRSAEILLDALLLMRIDNRKNIISKPVMMINGEHGKYDAVLWKKRYSFIRKVREGIHESVNKQLCDQNLDPILKEDEKMVYLNFLEKALGESWIASRLSDIYVKYAPKPESAAALSSEMLPKPVLPFKMAKIQKRQELKVRFYDYCSEKHPAIKLKSAKVNEFFEKNKLPTPDAEQAFFESYIRKVVMKKEASRGPKKKSWV